MNKIPLTHVNIIEMLGIASLSDEVKHDIVMSAVELIETRTLTRILDTLDETSREGFERLLHDSEDVQAISSFLIGHGIDYLKITEEETEKVKEELLPLGEEY